MGQKHQVFIIARLIPHGSTTGKPYYRCIAARHHQWCHGYLALAATHRFLTLIKNEDNAEIIRDELHRAQCKYGRREENPLMPAMPCPYTLLLLTQAWNMDLNVEDAYATGDGLESDTLEPNMGSFGAPDNNDGISIIDVTNPRDPAYCFVADIYEDEPRPVDMRGYIAEYHHMSDVEATIAVKAVSALERVRVLTSDALAEAWPDEYNIDDPSPEPHAAEPAKLQNQNVPSLVDLALSPAVDNALANNDIGQLGHLLMIPGKAELVKKYLMTKNPLPESGTALLANIIITHDFESTGRAILDLSEYPCLSSDQVVHIVNALADTLPGRIKSLKLSGNRNISTTTVVEVLRTVPRLLRLVLLNTSITDDQLLELISTSPNLFFNLHDLVHPVFLRSVELGDQKMFWRRIVPETLHPAYRHGLTFVSFGASDMFGREGCDIFGREGCDVFGRNASDKFVGDVSDVFGGPGSRITTTPASVPFFNPEQLLIKLTRQLSIITHSENPYFSYAYVRSGLGPILALSAGTTVVDPCKTQRSTAKDGTTSESLPSVSVDGGSDWYSRSVVSFPRSGSFDCFKGLGWIFVLKCQTSASPRYGFVKVDEEMQEKSKENGKLVPGLFKIYHVKDFLREMEKEGRPIPSKGVVDAFVQALRNPWIGPARLLDRVLEDPKRVILISDEEFQELLDSTSANF
ncbi:hypothetical protein K435DRAFT_751721 [Dendrothele bispora CBS 962.96]|uniref:RNI-like protein n=1 Tax=Dendrothele bispora (strain CBS 962.96) TaxID=1314807 RepID=A0A4S8MBN4_DENBC|nr:hypothetical protein K435DRAFT_751721 [Dendrothele bispora CBS 962.96]